jgi:hypothetical protein
MLWPWWVYCIVPGTATTYVLFDMWINRRQTKSDNPYASGMFKRMDEL